MKKSIPIYFLLFLFSTYCVSYSQTLESIKNADTLYIYFDKEHKNTVKYHNANKHIDFYKNFIAYEFNPHPSSIIHFNSNTYKDYDNLEKDIKNDERIEKKSFLKKNKDIILDYAFFERYGFKETFFEIYKKTVYLIDKEEIKGRKIKVKQVDIACFTCFEE